MAATSPVTRMITAAAREALGPLGVAQQGRSRVWIDDHGWWLGVVEFTPLRLAGSSMHVGAMWLWHDVDHFAFHVDGDRAGQESFRDEVQFAPRAADLARRAALDVTGFRERFPSLPAVASFLTSRPLRRGFLWDGLDAGIAAALVGEPVAARASLDRVLAEEALAPWMVGAQDTARFLHDLADDSNAVGIWAAEAVRSCRANLKLAPAALPFGDESDSHEAGPSVAWVSDHEHG